MEHPLSSRQTHVLKALIDEYIETAEPVGSLALEKKYTLGVSPATIRNEMATLTDLGFLRQPHTSSGRVPAPKAMKFYISQLMDERSISFTEEVRAKEEVKNGGEDINKIMEYATKTLATKTGCLAIASTDTGEVWSHGYSNIFDSPEFYNYQVTQSLFSILDQHTRLRELFFKRLTGLSPIEVLFGEEIGWDFFEPVGVVAARFEVANGQCAIGVFGPYRLNYSTVIPMVRYFGQLVNQALGPEDEEKAKETR